MYFLFCFVPSSYIITLLYHIIFNILHSAHYFLSVSASLLMIGHYSFINFFPFQCRHRLIASPVSLRWTGERNKTKKKTTIEIDLNIFWVDSVRPFLFLPSPCTFIIFMAIHRHCHCAMIGEHNNSFVDHTIVSPRSLPTPISQNLHYWFVCWHLRSSDLTISHLHFFRFHILFHILSIVFQ